MPAQRGMKDGKEAQGISMAAKATRKTETCALCNATYTDKAPKEPGYLRRYLGSGWGHQEVAGRVRVVCPTHRQ